MSAISALVILYVVAIIYTVNAFLQTRVLEQSNDGPYGEWGLAAYCKSGHFARGFKIKVECCGGDDTSANAIHLLCASSPTSTSYDEVTMSNDGSYGDWSSNTVCPSGTFIIGFDQKVESDQGGLGDDTELNSIKAKCSDGSYIEASNAAPYGSFTNSYKECEQNSYVCGFNQKVEAEQGSGDDTSLNALKLFCCSYNYYIESGVSSSTLYSQTATLEQSNDGPWGDWGGATYCNDGEFVRGIKQKVESYVHSGDDTAGNAIRSLCASSSTATSYNTISASNESPWGDWSSDSVCPSGSYVTGFKQKVETEQGTGDDTALNSVKVKCSDGSEREPSNGGDWGDWSSSWVECSSGTYVCGFNQKVEVCSSCDDTAMNAVKMYCCRPSSQTISVKTWSDANDYCQDIYGSLLAKFESDNQLNELLRLRDLNSDTKSKTMWIGLNDIDSEGHWEWADDSDCGGNSCDDNALDWWNNGEPNNSGGEDCAEIRSSASTDNFGLALNDNQCSRTYPFACNAPKYIFVNSAKTWFEANTYCAVEYQTQLATIKNDDDANEILRIRAWNNANGEILWVGLNDLREEGDWEWVDGYHCNGNCDSVSYWNTNEPNNSGGEDCAELRSSNTDINLMLNDNQCWHTRKFLCNSPSGGVVSDYDADLWSCFDSGQRGSGTQMDGYKYCGCGDNYGVTGIYRNSCNSLYCIEEMRCGQPFGGTSTCKNENIHSSFDSAGTVYCDDDYVLSGFLLNSNGNCMNLYCIEQLRCCKFSDYHWNVEYHNDWYSSFDNKGWHTVAGNQYITGIYRSGTNDLRGIEKVISHHLQTDDESAAYQQALALKYAPILKFDRSAGEYPCTAEQTNGYYEANVVTQNDMEDADAYAYLNTDITKSETFYKVETGCTDGIKIQYRWFYAVQPNCIDSVYTAGKHYADWEYITVHIGTGDAIRKVSYWAHGDYYTLNEGQFYYDGSHPIVYVGRYSHGSFYDFNDFGGGFAPFIDESMACGHFLDYRDPEDEADWFVTYQHPMQRLFDMDWSSYNGCWNWDDPSDCGISTDFSMDLCSYTTCTGTGCDWEVCDDEIEVQFNSVCLGGAHAGLGIVDRNKDRNYNNDNAVYVLGGLFVLVIITTIVNMCYCFNKNDKNVVVSPYDTE